MLRCGCDLHANGTRPIFAVVNDIHGGFLGLLNFALDWMAARFSKNEGVADV
jgi:hypothetical protein